MAEHQQPNNGSNATATGKYQNLRQVMDVGATGGVVTIKAQCADEIRRIPILNRELTYNELCLMMQRLFKGRLGEGAADAQLALKYRDDEGDLISITDDLDISHALSISPVLKIVVATGATKRPSQGKPLLLDTDEFIAELKAVQERVAKMLATVEAQQQAAAAQANDPGKKPAATATDKKSLVKTLTTSDMAELLDSPRATPAAPKSPSVDAGESTAAPAVSVTPVVKAETGMPVTSQQAVPQHQAPMTMPQPQQQQQSGVQQIPDVQQQQHMHQQMYGPPPPQQYYFPQGPPQYYQQSPPPPGHQYPPSAGSPGSYVQQGPPPQGIYGPPPSQQHRPSLPSLAPHGLALPPSQQPYLPPK